MFLVSVDYPLVEHLLLSPYTMQSPRLNDGYLLIIYFFFGRIHSRTFALLQRKFNSRGAYRRTDFRIRRLSTDQAINLKTWKRNGEFLHGCVFPNSKIFFIEIVGRNWNKILGCPIILFLFSFNLEAIIFLSSVGKLYSFLTGTWKVPRLLIQDSWFASKSTKCR